MLGIGCFGLSLDESRGEPLTAKLLLRSPYCLVCSKHRWPAKRDTPKLSDFRDDNFLVFLPEVGGDYQHLLRTVCQLDGGFEPKLLPIGNNFDTLISMVSAGRGVCLLPEIGLRDRTPGINFHVLKESKNQFELNVIGKKHPEPVATVNNFAKILFAAVRRLPGNAGETH
jgi:DNA-binding transcriptional LysR family regulator